MLRTIILLTTMLLASSCAEKLQWQDYNATNIEQLTSEEKTVFVQYTADWCVTCIAQEEILSSQEIITLFEDNNVVLIRADWTEYSSKIEEDIKLHVQPGVPMYIIYSEKTGFKAKMLPELITEKSIIDNI